MGKHYGISQGAYSRWWPQGQRTRRGRRFYCTTCWSSVTVNRRRPHFCLRPKRRRFTKRLHALRQQHPRIRRLGFREANGVELAAKFKARRQR